jgi:hypothetical protein
MDKISILNTFIKGNCCECHSKGALNITGGNKNFHIVCDKCFNNMTPYFETPEEAVLHWNESQDGSRANSNADELYAIQLADLSFNVWIRFAKNQGRESEDIFKTIDSIRGINKLAKTYGISKKNRHVHLNYAALKDNRRKKKQKKEEAFAQQYGVEYASYIKLINDIHPKLKKCIRELHQLPNATYMSTLIPEIGKRWEQIDEYRIHLEKILTDMDRYIDEKTSQITW